MSTQFLYTTLLLFSPLLCTWNLAAAQECETGWVAFSDQKCYKLFDQLLTMADADSLCYMESGSDDISPLVSITSPEEQELITNMLFVQLGVMDNVWLGAIGQNGAQFSWQDGSAMEFTNWHEGYPSGVEGHDCVQMVPKGDKTIFHGSQSQSQLEGDLMYRSGQRDDVAGRWTDTSCLRRNLVLCQKMQNWSLKKLQKVAMTTSKNLEKTVEELNAAKTELTTDLHNLRQNPVPIGFVYVQLPGQPDAKTAWPQVEWLDITGEYAGLFFRAEGSGSAAFGTTQGDSTRQIDRVEFESVQPGYAGIISLPLTGWSEFVISGARTSTTQNYWEALRFETSNVEVRPTNTAVRIFKRTA